MRRLQSVEQCHDLVACRGFVDRQHQHVAGPGPGEHAAGRLRLGQCGNDARIVEPGAAQRMEQLVAQQPGFLGAESTRDHTGFGITVAYFEDEAAIAGWRNNAEHAAARERGRNEWYELFELRIARVERAYGGPPAPRTDAT